MRKILSAVLLAIMLVTLLAMPSLAEERIALTTSMLELGASNYNSDPVYDYFADACGIELEVMPVTWDNYLEKPRIWINGGTMPDTIFWDFNYSEYKIYVDQGLIAPLPDGWETKYPNLYKMALASGVLEKLYVDGKCYCIPHTTYYQFASVDRAVAHAAVYYRKDWADKLGLDIGNKLTVSQMKEYARMAIDADLAGNGKTIGITTSEQKTETIAYAFNPNYDRFVKRDGKYVWGAGLHESVDAVNAIRDLYTSGVLDPDYYLNSTTDPSEKLVSGSAFMMIFDGAVGNYSRLCDEFAAANPGTDPYEYIIPAALLADDGTWCGPFGVNFWTSILFSPDMDEKEFDAMLRLCDLQCTREGQIISNMGLKGVDWEYAEDGQTPVMIRKPNEDGSIPSTESIYDSCYMWEYFTVLRDDFSCIDPSADPRAVSRINELLKLRIDLASDRCYVYDPDAELFSSDAKANYSLNVREEITKLVLEKDTDVEAAWAKFTADNAPLWQPVVDDLNAAFGNE